MNILLVRHGKKADDLAEIDDKDLPLSDQGKAEVQQLAAEFAEAGLLPSLYLSSRYVHALDTARAISEKLVAGNAPPASVPLDSLTPHNPYTFALIVREAAKIGLTLNGVDTACMVLHYPRIHQLTAELTSTALETNDPGYASASCVTAASLDELLQGKGHTRYVWRRTKDRILTRRNYQSTESARF